MNQFATVFFGGYRKDAVDERLKELIDQIELLQKEKSDAAERENRLKEELEEAKKQAESAGPKGGVGSAELEQASSQREEELEKELAEALERLNALEEELAKNESAEQGGQSEQQRASLKEELAAALRWSESLEMELKQARDEKSARTQTRLMELERTKTLNRRILELEDELDEAEAEHRRELSRLQEQLDHQAKTSAATERVLAQAEEEARMMIVEAQERVQELERQTELDVRAKKQAAAKALDGARAQIIQYLDAFNATRNKLTVTYDELGALVDQIPRTDDTIIELDRDDEGGSWTYVPNERKK